MAWNPGSEALVIQSLKDFMVICGQRWVKKLVAFINWNAIRNELELGNQAYSHTLNIRELEEQWDQEWERDLHKPGTYKH